MNKKQTGRWEGQKRLSHFTGLFKKIFCGQRCPGNESNPVDGGIE